MIVRDCRESEPSGPLRLNFHPQNALRMVISGVLDIARRRQSRDGLPVVATVMRTLVAARLEIVNGWDEPDAMFCGINVSAGEFPLKESIVYVPVVPNIDLVQKCLGDISAGRRSLVITTSECRAGVLALAVDDGIEKVIEVVDFLNYFVSGILVESRFREQEFEPAISRLIGRYNHLIEIYRTHPDLTIRTGCYTA